MTTELDAVDRKLLRELQLDGRAPNVVLAERVGLSQSPCLRRVRRLEETGVIRGYTAIVDQEAIGRRLTILVRVRLDRQTREMIEAFERSVSSLDAVLDCYLMVGDTDYFIRVAMPDLEAYREWYMEHLAQFAGAAAIESQVVMATIKQSGRLETR